MKPEGDKKPKELKDEIAEIQDRDSLFEWEVQHRNEIMQGPVELQAEVNQKWKELTGDYYFQPITAQPVAYTPNVGHKRIDPKGQNYRAQRSFTAIEWRSGKVKTRKDKVETFFTLAGTLTGGRRRIIRQNLRLDNIEALFIKGEGNKITKAIMKDSQAGKTEGFFDGDFVLEVEGYWEVIFAPASSKDDPIDVVLQWEGHCLQIQRNEPVIMPGTYLEVVDNAKYPVYTQDPERSKEGRKIQGWVQFYPYSVLREATEEEYIKMKKAGDEATKRARREAMQ